MSALFVVVTLAVSTTSQKSMGVFAETQVSRYALTVGARATGRFDLLESFEFAAHLSGAALTDDGTPFLDAAAGLQWRLLATTQRSLCISLTAGLGWAGVWPTVGASVLGRVTGTNRLGDRWALSLSVIAGLLYDAAVLKYEGRLALPLGGDPIVALAPHGGLELMARFSATRSLALVALADVRVMALFGAPRLVGGFSFGPELTW